VLGSIKSNQAWEWGAFGKHPVARDYIRIGPETPLMQAFSRWIENGYALLNTGKNHACKLYSWRFWAKGFKKDHLVCGLVRDSGDSLGRPFPFLVLGSGGLKGWERNWEKLPISLDKIWKATEFLCTKRYHNFHELERDVTMIPSVVNSWAECDKKEQAIPSTDNAYMLEQIEKLIHGPQFSLAIQGKYSDDYSKTFELLHRLVRARINDVPNAVFIGGIVEQSYLAVYRRSLAPVDFVKLWSSFPMEI